MSTRPKKVIHVSFPYVKNMLNGYSSFCYLVSHFDIFFYLALINVYLNLVNCYLRWIKFSPRFRHTTINFHSKS